MCSRGLQEQALAGSQCVRGSVVEEMLVGSRAAHVCCARCGTGGQAVAAGVCRE